ncbi:hypothetical protein ACFLSE_09110 [Bacteroidota bacterium]
MKCLFLILFCFISLTGYSQKEESPIVYLNGTEIDLNNVFLNPNSIDSVRVEKKTKVGEVYFYAKNSIEFINLDSVLISHTNLDKEQNDILYIVENKVIKSESNVLIDKSFFIYVKTNFLNDVDYLDENFKNLIIVDISLKSKEQIILRGDRTPIDYLIYK